MTAKVLPIEAYEAVCWECDWHGGERDERSDAQTDVERHNAECHAGAA